MLRPMLRLSRTFRQHPRTSRIVAAGARPVSPAGRRRRGADGAALRHDSETNVPAAPAIDPVTKGLRVLITDSTGATPLDATMPGGAYDTVNRVGWRVNGTGTAWTYKNAGSPVPLVNGIQKAQLKRPPRPTSAPADRPCRASCPSAEGTTCRSPRSSGRRLATGGAARGRAGRVLEDGDGVVDLVGGRHVEVWLRTAGRR